MTGNLVSAPAKALSHLFGDESGFLDYGNLETFQSLWFDGLESGKVIIGEREFDFTDTTQPVLLIGNDPPDSVFGTAPPSLKGINFRSHFTASSWLAAWRLRFPESSVRIAVIDPRERDLATGAAKALQSLLGATDSESRSLVPGVTVLNAPGLEAICRWLSESEPLIASKDFPQILDLLRSTIWNELTSDREQHHALSNVIGALLLTSQVGPAAASAELMKSYKQRFPQQEFLMALARACGVDAEATRLDSGPEGPAAVPPWWIGEALHSQIPGAVLIDDMTDLWSWFLRLALAFCGADYAHRFVTTQESKFDSIIDGLPARLHSALDRSSKRLTAADFVPGSHQVREDFVLFLDLRLFKRISSNHSPGEAETRFLGELAEFGLALLSSKRSLPWLESREDRDGLKADLDALKKGELSPHTETILARLVSLMDPTLPIVIFSSTQRTDLIDPFRNHGNIVTKFRKPVLNALNSDWPTTLKGLHTDFGEAVNAAAKILQVRTMLRPHAPGLIANNDPREKLKAIEIFVDESILNDFDVKGPDGETRKQSVMAVGAVVCMAENHSSIESFCRRLEEESLHWGLSITNRDRFIEETRRPWADGATGRLECHRGWFIRPQPDDFVWLAKKPRAFEIKDAALRIARVADEEGIDLFAVSLSCDPDREDGLAGRHELNWDPISADEWHRELTKRLLQILFVGHPKVAEVLCRDDCSLAFDLGDRVQELEGGREECEELFQAYGIRYTSQDLTELTEEEEESLRNRHPNNRGMTAWVPTAKAITVASDHALFSLREALSSLRSQIGQIAIERCRSTALIDFDDLQGGPGSWLHRLSLFPAFPNQIHYLADWVSRSSSFAALWGDEQWAPLQSLVESGFHQHWTPRTRELLDLVLAGLEGRRSEAIAGIHAWVSKYREPEPGERLLLARADSFADHLGGEELKSLFAKEEAG